MTTSSHNNLLHIHSKDSRFLINPTTPNELLSPRNASVVGLPQRPLQAYRKRSPQPDLFDFQRREYYTLTHPPLLIILQHR